MYLVPAKGISTFPMEGIATRQSPFYEPPCSRSLCSLTIQTTRRYSLLASYRFIVGLGTSHMENSCHTILFDLSIVAFRGINHPKRPLEWIYFVGLGIRQPTWRTSACIILFVFSFSEKQSTITTQLRLVAPVWIFVDATLLPSAGHPSQLRHDVCRARPLPRRS